MSAPASPRVDIRGLDKPALLQALVDNAKFMGGPLRALAKMLPPLSREAAEAELKKQKGYVDYCQCKPIKSDLSKDEVDPRLYDRDNGEGAFKRAVDEMRMNCRNCQFAREFIAEVDKMVAMRDQ